MKHLGSNNTNKFSPQERKPKRVLISASSNNTNKFSPQEPLEMNVDRDLSSNNTNKFSPQERTLWLFFHNSVQIIQINLVLKNLFYIGGKENEFK